MRARTGSRKPSLRHLPRGRRMGGTRAADTNPSVWRRRRAERVKEDFEERNQMFGRTKTQAVKDHAATSKEFALALSRDKKFRKQLLSAIGHGAKAKRRAAKRVGFLAAATRLAQHKDTQRE